MVQVSNVCNLLKEPKKSPFYVYSAGGDTFKCGHRSNFNGSILYICKD